MLLPGWTAHTVPHKHCITSSVFRSFSISIYTCIFLVLWDVDLTVRLLQLHNKCFVIWSFYCLIWSLQQFPSYLAGCKHCHIRNDLCKQTILRFLCVFVLDASREQFNSEQIPLNCTHCSCKKLTAGSKCGKLVN